MVAMTQSQETVRLKYEPLQAKLLCQESKKASYFQSSHVIYRIPPKKSAKDSPWQILLLRFLQIIFIILYNEENFGDNPNIFQSICLTTTEIIMEMLRVSCRKFKQMSQHLSSGVGMKMVWAKR